MLFELPIILFGYSFKINLLLFQQKHPFVIESILIKHKQVYIHIYLVTLISTKSCQQQVIPSILYRKSLL